MELLQVSLKKLLSSRLYHDIDSKASMHLNNCNAQGELKNVRCQCYTGFYGADCSIAPDNSIPATVELFPRQWSYYAIDSASEEIQISVSSQDNIIHLYSKVGDSPSRSRFDGLLKGSSIKQTFGQSSVSTVIALHNPSKTDSIIASVSMSSSSTVTI